jgi:hypothetical protein
MWGLAYACRQFMLLLIEEATAIRSNTPPLPHATHPLRAQATASPVGRSEFKKGADSSERRLLTDAHCLDDSASSGRIRWSSGTHPTKFLSSLIWELQIRRRHLTCYNHYLCAQCSFASPPYLVLTVTNLCLILLWPAILYTKIFEPRS